MHRTTIWTDDAGNTVRVAVACLDSAWEPHAEVTLEVGPFDTVEEVAGRAQASAHDLGGWRAHQGELTLD